MTPLCNRAPPGREYAREWAAHHPLSIGKGRQILAVRSRSELPITDTELKDIAAAAKTGDSSRPNAG